MKLFDLFSGFIAAVVIALGAGLYANENTSVGEELVVEEVKETLRVDRWVMIEFIDPNGLQTDPENQKITGVYSSGVVSPCNELSGTICALKLSTTEDPDDFINMTVDDVLDLGLAEHPDPMNPQYSHFK